MWWWMLGFSLDGKRVKAYARFLVCFCLLFFPVYGGAGYWAAHHAPRLYALYLPWERAIPLVPWMIWPYLSLYVLFVLPLLVLTPEQLKVLSRQSTVCLLLAGAAFVLVPGRNGYAPEALAGFYGHMYQVLHVVDAPSNLVPSLHVVFSALILWACAEQAHCRRATPIFAIWLLVLCASTLLTHQHHLLDVVSGLLLAWGVRRAWPLPSGSARKIKPPASGV